MSTSWIHSVSDLRKDLQKNALAHLQTDPNSWHSLSGSLSTAFLSHALRLPNASIDTISFLSLAFCGDHGSHLETPGPSAATEFPPKSIKEWQKGEMIWRHSLTSRKMSLFRGHLTLHVFVSFGSRNNSSSSRRTMTHE